MVGSSPAAKKSQPTISRFFQKSTPKVSANSNNRSSPTKPQTLLVTDNLIEIIDSDDEEDVQELDKPIESPIKIKDTHSTVHQTQQDQDTKDRYIPETSISPVFNDEQIITEEGPRRDGDFVYKKDMTVSQPSPTQIELRQRLKRQLSQSFFKDTNTGSTDYNDDEEDLEDEREEQQPKPTKKSKKSKLTPLDQQVKDLKLKHPDKILAIQVGYKYKFYCQDAVVVHRILSIRLVPGKINIENETTNDLEYNKLAYCSIPEPRLHIHLQRLLDKGLKIGIVQQMETSSIHSMENGSNALIERSITNIFTKATYLEYDSKGNEGIKDDKSMDSLMAIIERSITPLISKFTVVAIQPLTGEIICDEFEDNFLRNELNTRLSHLEPIELLYFTDNFSKTTNNVIKHFKQKNSSTSIRETFYNAESDYKSFQNKFNEFINGELESQNEELTNFLIQQNEELQVCITILFNYLEEYGLNNPFKMREKYITFLQANHMILTADTLENLEVFHNTFNGSTHGSLIWLLDHTRTKFGYRMLKQWIAKPLIDREAIGKRLDAVQELSSGFNHFLESFTNTLKNCPDLDKILNRLHYGKVKRKELYMFLCLFNDFERLFNKFGAEEILKKLKSDLLVEIFEKLISTSKDIQPSSYVKLINGQIALDDSFSKAEDHVLKYFNLNSLSQVSEIEHGELKVIMENIEHIELEFQNELKHIKQLLKRPALEYVEKNREPYLIEVRQALVKNLPDDWIKINSTKMVARYRSPKMTALYKKMQYYQELYLKQMNSIFSHFVKLLNSKHYLQFNQFIQTLANFDVLLSLTVTSIKPDHCRPEFTDAKSITLRGSRNPIIEALNPKCTTNDIMVDQSKSCFIVTGPNMGGKSSIVKQIALLTIMAQIGCFVPATVAKMGIFNSILIRMGAFDNLIKGESTFFIEMSQVLNILNCLNTNDGNALVILDEVGRGTSTVDGIAIAESIVEYILQNPEIAQKTLCLFITHFPSICKLSKKYSNLENYHMSYLEEKANEENPWSKVTFLYQFVKGVATNSYGLNVAKLASIDGNILKKAHVISKEREAQVEKRRTEKEVKKLLSVLNSEENSEDLIQILDSIDLD